jgi:hypothetical protein
MHARLRCSCSTLWTGWRTYKAFRLAAKQVGARVAVGENGAGLQLHRLRKTDDVCTYSRSRVSRVYFDQPHQHTTISYNCNLSFLRMIVRKQPHSLSSPLAESMGFFDLSVTSMRSCLSRHPRRGTSHPAQLLLEVGRAQWGAEGLRYRGNQDFAALRILLNSLKEKQSGV